jgi:hypothetical protein
MIIVKLSFPTIVNNVVISQTAPVYVKVLYGNTQGGGGGGGGSVAWNDITGKPATFAPSSHTHPISEITNLQSSLNAKENTIPAGTTGEYYRGDKTFQTLDKIAVGLGNVDNTSDANKPISSATQSALNGKANTSHGHAISDVSGLQTALDGKAPTSHSHAISDVTNLQSSLNDKAPLVITANRQTASYTLVLADAYKIVEMNVASANNLTVPPNSSVAFPTGTQILIAQYGAGQTTVVAGSGVTVRSSGAKLKLSGQYSGGTLLKIGTNEWYLFGDISA